MKRPGGEGEGGSRDGCVMEEVLDMWGWGGWEGVKGEGGGCVVRWTGPVSRGRIIVEGSLGCVGWLVDV